MYTFCEGALWVAGHKYSYWLDNFTGSNASHSISPLDSLYTDCIK